jgi:isopentenyl-diphosphate delta-isomerase
MITLENLILVDQDDNQIGVEEKLKAHKEGKLHRAFSIFIFNSNKELLLQKRALRKYHCPGLWTNTCCSHPRPGESTANAARRRLKEEMGFDTQLQEIFSFIYKKDLENGLIEHEYDHVFVGVYDGMIEANSTEVEEYRYARIDDLKKEVHDTYKNFTPWFLICYDRVIKYFNENIA